MRWINVLPYIYAQIKLDVFFADAAEWCQCAYEIEA
jgi:hypothetical protein